MPYQLPPLAPTVRTPRRITLHWTAGAYDPSALELKHYHWLIDGDGDIRAGVDMRLNCPRIQPGYAAHTGRANTNNVGVAICAMAEASQGHYGRYPIKAQQVEAACDLIADLCRTYGIDNTPRRVLGHCEWTTILDVPQSGKWDVGVIPHAGITWKRLPDGTVAAMNYIRALVAQRLP